MRDARKFSRRSSHSGVWRAIGRGEGVRPLFHIMFHVPNPKSLLFLGLFSSSSLFHSPNDHRFFHSQLGKRTDEPLEPFPGAFMRDFGALFLPRPPLGTTRSCASSSSSEAAFMPSSSVFCRHRASLQSCERNMESMRWNFFGFRRGSLEGPMFVIPSLVCHYCFGRRKRNG